MLNLLLSNRSPINATDVAGYTPLHHGIMSPYRAEVEVYAEHFLAISEGHGDAALLLLKQGAETDKRDVDGYLAIDLAPDSKVMQLTFLSDSG
jgi:26S proteasome non-ATPase regulatory subunit 10